MMLRLAEITTRKQPPSITLREAFTIRNSGCHRWAAGSSSETQAKLTEQLQEDLPTGHKHCLWPVCKANEMP